MEEYGAFRKSFKDLLCCLDYRQGNFLVARKNKIRHFPEFNEFNEFNGLNGLNGPNGPTG
jgi:hypothetical protein